MNQAPARFALKPRLSLSLQRVGIEQEPVLIVEGLLQEPDALVQYAQQEAEFAPIANPDGYPGIWAPAPLDYVSSVVKALSPSIERAFGLNNVKLSRAECRLSLVTLPPEQLTPLQQVPHVDTVDPLQFALLHYLCPPTFGGTAFYRHRSTGFETLTAERWPLYQERRDREIGSLVPRGYIIADSEHYEQTKAIDAEYDRLIIYRSRLLHSGIIRAPAELSPEPAKGRLTANIFVNYRAA